MSQTPPGQTRYRISIRYISEEEYEKEQRMKDILYKEGIEVAQNEAIIERDIQIPNTCFGIVQFERDVFDLCDQYQYPNWHK